MRRYKLSHVIASNHVIYSFFSLWGKSPNGGWCSYGKIAFHLFRFFSNGPLCGLGSFAAEALLCRKRWLHSDAPILPQEVDIVFLADTDVEQGGSSSECAFPPALQAALSPSTPFVFQDERHLDSFSRSRIVNFIKRYDKNRVINNGKDIFQTTTFSNGAAGSQESQLYHCRIGLPLSHPDAAKGASGAIISGSLWAHGVACGVQDAEMLAAMHAERIIDMLGYHIYVLPSMQRRHAAAARSAGRFAPSPDDIDTTHLPPASQFPLPLRRILTKDESENGAWQLLDMQGSARYRSPSTALLSPCVFDPNAQTRLEMFFKAHAFCLAQLCTVYREAPVEKGEPPFFIATIRIPSEITQHPDAVVIAQGKSLSRENAVALACMHAELVLDSLSIPLFPHSDAKQKEHAMAAWSFGRAAPLCGAAPTNPCHQSTPLPLKELYVRKEGRFSTRGYEEEQVHRHLVITQQITDFMESSICEVTAVADLRGFLKTHKVPRAENPFFHELIHNTVKSTVVLPLPSAYGIRGGVGIATREEDADTLAAMHALDLLTALGISIKDGTPQEEVSWKVDRAAKLQYEPTPLGPADPSSPGRRLSAKCFSSRVHVNSEAASARVTRPDEAATASTAGGQGMGNTCAGHPPPAPTRTTEEGANGDAPRKGRRVAKRVQLRDASTSLSYETSERDDHPPHPVAADHLALRMKVPREQWSLEADSPDGYIMVAPKEGDLQPHNDAALRSPRQLDHFSRERVAQYLASVGRRIEDIFKLEFIDAEENGGQGVHTCAGRIPVPQRYGNRVALGEAPGSADALLLATMHAELILDTLGICLFRDATKQRRHAEACARCGRWAPSGPGEEQPADTPSPPPLRREYIGSLHWERQQEKRRPRCVSRSGAKTGVFAKASVGVKHDEEGGSLSDFACNSDKSTAPALDARMSEEEKGGEMVSPEMEANVTATSASPVYTPVTEKELDTVSKQRVQYYLYSQKKTTAVEAEYKCSINRGTVLHTASWSLPLPEGLSEEGGQSLSVQGVAATKRDAEILSWMHAERLLDAIGIPIFGNLPKFQRFHVERVEKLGRTALTLIAYEENLAAVKERLRRATEQLPVPALRLEEAMTPHLGRPCYPAGATPTNEAWSAYVDSCSKYIHQQTLSIWNSFFEMEKVPRTGDTVVDESLEEVEALPVDPDSKLLLQNYCNCAAYHYPTVWRNQVVGRLQHRVSWVTLRVPGFDYLQAQGVGATKEAAQRRAAMHALAMLARVDPDYDLYNTQARLATKSMRLRDPSSDAMADSENDHKDDDDAFDLETFSMPLIASPSTTPASSCAAAATTSTERRRKDQANLYDKQTNTFTGLGKERVVELFTVCQDVAAPEVRHWVRYREGKVLYSTTVRCIDEEGKEWVGKGSGAGLQQNKSEAFVDLFENLQRGADGYLNAVQELYKKHLWLNPKTLVSVRLTPRQKQSFHAVLDRVPVDIITGSAAACNAGGEAAAPMAHTPSSAGARECDDHTAHIFQLRAKDAAQSARETERLLKRHAERLASCVYLESYAKSRERLSIYPRRDEIVSTIQSNAVTIICGTTGCGKTTQVPQFILEHLTAKAAGGDCSVLVTQPRRLSAVSIAQRVAAERLERVGEDVGYSIRFDTRPGRHINFCTSGILLRMLHRAPNLEGVNYLIIDEIHERDINSDFLIILLRDILQRRLDLRVVLMSATLQAEQFGKYFQGAPILNIEGQVHPVQELFIEDLVPFAEQHGFMTPLLKEAAVSIGELSSHDEMRCVDVGSGTNWLDRAVQGGQRRKYGMLEVTTDIDYLTVQFAIEQATRMVDLSGSSILVFLPGWEEIVRAKEILERNAAYQIITLHSSVRHEEQTRCFLPAREGKIKLILSTNIAESGITIDDIGAVIDVGRAKEKSLILGRSYSQGSDVAGRVSDKDTLESTDEHGGVSQLRTVYASRANSVQRRGRVGRTRPGVCIRLYSRKHFEQLHDFQTPEMLRTPLDALCLQIIALHLGDPTTFLQKALDPPATENVEAALKRLQDLGATTAENTLMALGQRLAMLPVEPRMGKVILMGAIFRCLDSALTIASVAQVDVFKPGREYRDAVRLHREDLSKGTQSDALASVNGYNYWVTCHYQQPSTEVMYALEERLLSVPQLWFVSRLKKQFFDILHEGGFLVPPPEAGEREAEWTARVQDYRTKASAKAHLHDEVFVEKSEFSTDACDVGLAKCVVAAGLLPQIAKHRQHRLVCIKSENVVFASADSVFYRTPPRQIKQPLFVYAELAKSQESGRLVARGLSSVPLWAVLLMTADNLTITYNQELNMGLIDGWILFRASFGTVEVIKKFRRAMQYSLARKFKDPYDFENSRTVEMVRSVIQDLLRTPVKPNRLVEEVWEENGILLEPQVNCKEEGLTAQTPTREGNSVVCPPESSQRATGTPLAKNREGHGGSCGSAATPSRGTFQKTPTPLEGTCGV